MKQKYLETGIVVGTHGIKGELRVQPWSDSPQFLADFNKLYIGDDKSEISVVSRPHKNIVLMKISGVDTIEAAEALRNKVVYINRDDIVLPKGSYFQTDLIGCKVFDADSGESLGEVTDVSQTGANDVWHITKNHKEYLVPSIPDVVLSVDIDEQKVVIRPLKGIFDDED